MRTVYKQLLFFVNNFVTDGGEKGGTKEEIEEVGDAQRPQTPAWRHPEHDHHYLDRADVLMLSFLKSKKNARVQYATEKFSLGTV